MREAHTSFWYNPVFIVAVIGMLSQGSLSPNCSQWAYHQETRACKDTLCESEYYNGFMAQLWTKYLCMSLSANLLYGIDRHRYSKMRKPVIVLSKDIEANRLFKKRQHWICVFGAICDVTATVCERVATFYTKASTNSLIGNLSVLVASISRLTLNREGIMTCEYLGMIVLVGGGVSFGVLDAFKENEEGPAPLSPKLGVCISVLGAIMRGIHYAVHQKVFAKRHYPQTKYTSIESTISLTLTVILTLIFWASGFVDAVSDFWATVNNPTVAVAVILFGLTAALFNVSGIIAGGYVSGLYRILIVRITSVFTWIWEMCFGFGQFSYYSLTANIFVILGSFIFAGLFVSRTRFAWYFYAPVCGKIQPPPAASNHIPKKEKLECTHSSDDTNFSPITPVIEGDVSLLEFSTGLVGKSMGV